MFKNIFNSIFKTERNWKWLMIGALVGLIPVALAVFVWWLVMNQYLDFMTRYLHSP